MPNFLVKLNLTSGNLQATSKEVEMLISHKDDIISQLVFNQIPRIVEDNCNVVGSLNVIEAFNNIDNEKIDYLLDLDNVKFSNLTQDGIELAFRIPENDNELIVETIYGSDKKLLDKFDLTKYYEYCLSINQDNLAIQNIKEMLVINREEKYQFRTLKFDGKTYLRSITSKVYKNYDNHRCYSTYKDLILDRRLTLSLSNRIMDLTHEEPYAKQRHSRII